VTTANARLIAAAPDLLAALQWAAKNLKEVAIPMAEGHGHVTSLDSALERALAALAKAQGEGGAE